MNTPFAKWSPFEYALLAAVLLISALSVAAGWHGVLNAVFSLVAVALVGYFCFMAARLVWLLFKPLR